MININNNSNPHNLTDAQLLVSLQSPDNQSHNELLWCELITRYHDPLEKKAIYLLKGDDFWAGDLVQNTWIKAHKSIKQCQGNLRGWLYKILMNQFRDDLRKNRLESTNYMISFDQVGQDEQEYDLTESAAGFIQERKAFEADADYLSGVEVSAEQMFLDNHVPDAFEAAVRTILSPADSDFFLGYQDDHSPKEGKAKVKYHRLKNKIKAANLM